VTTKPGIPPDGEVLRFARRNSTGTVHIREWVPGYGDDGYNPVPVPFAESIAQALMQRTGMLCGQQIRLLPGGPGCEGDGVGGDFDDSDLCYRCVMALGDQQWRAFHADSRGVDC
jgi:hypothetical protein